MSGVTGLKRNASKRLVGQTSEFNSSVTLFKLEDSDSDQLRRSKRVRTEIKKEEIDDLEDIIPPPLTKKRTAAKIPKTENSRTSASPPKSPKKAKAIPQALDKPHPAPEHWRETYDAIKAMRSRFVAPVDTMGCDQAQVKEPDPKNKPYTTLVSLMLSSQTKDEVVDAAVSNVREALGGTISVDGMIAASDETISQAIAKVGFWKKKTQYLKQTALILRERFDSSVPKTVDELCSLPGVGPKMAFLVLQVAWDLNVGIGVDVHVHRVTNLLRWHKPPTKTPEQTRLNLQSWLPKELHRDINHMLVGFGQVICVPVSPRCDQCDLPARGLCPSARKVTNVKNRKLIEFSLSEDAMPKVEITLDGLEELKPIPTP